MYREMDKTIRRSCAFVQPPFSAYGTQATRKPSGPFERAYNFNLETFLRFYINL